MSKKTTYPNRLTALIVAMVVTFATMLGIVSLDAYLSTWMLVTVPFAVGAIVFAAFEAAANGDEESRLKTSFIKLVSLLLPASLLLSTWFAVQSLWVSPFDERINRFALENLSTGFLIAGATMALLLSTMQQDRFWVTKRKPEMLDEREVAERQKVLEKSYIFAVAISVVTLWGYLGNIGAIDEIKRFDVSATVLPGHYFFPAYSAVVMLFSIPLILAVWQKKR